MAVRRNRLKARRYNAKEKGDVTAAFFRTLSKMLL
jgi:hypothetical protein